MSHADNTAIRAIKLSIRENRIAHLDASDLDGGDMTDLLCTCDDWTGSIDQEQGTEEEYWGTLDGQDWRVHVGPTGGCYDRV